MNLHLLSFILPLLFLLYQVIIDFMNLFPFNDVQARDKKLRKFEVFGNYPPLIIIAIFFYNEGVWAWIGYSMTMIIMVMHLFSWWIPYFTGYPTSVRKDYEKYFKRTYKFLPPIKDHIVPDAEHVGVGIILVTTVVIQSLYLFS
ncbi:hypothetical protein [Paenibacillus planticolens]|uniref:Uncharacterized protein n=1 Tax=Paenibacillus planticolens TaxID=2654976 RepID=A0ABX1ZUB2_9BACL|nr:hypothetical protein [Paenibacillus planticolens]NOV03639.1 hypothetical protein [Paenibacillus planticolens]